MNRLFKHGFMIIAALILLQGCVFYPIITMDIINIITGVNIATSINTIISDNIY